MERDERYEISSQGSLVVGIPTTLTPSEKKKMIEKMFSKISGAECLILTVMEKQPGTKKCSAYPF